MNILIILLFVIILYFLYKYYQEYCITQQVQYYVIQLDRIKERVENVNNIKRNINTINIFHAIDNEKLTDLDYAKYIKKGYLKENYKYDEIFKKPFLKGQIAVALSHLTIWNKLHNSMYKYNIIMEDDAYITPNFTESLQYILGEIPDTYDILYLYIHPHMLHLIGDDKLEIGKKYIIESPPMYGLIGYMISPTGAKKLSKYITPLQTAIDEAILILIREKKINAYSVRQSIIQSHGDIDQQTKKKLSSTIWNSVEF